jgi:hypothetical protein
MQDLFSQITASFTPLQIGGAILVALFLFKKLIKWAVIVGALFIVVIPYLNDHDVVHQIKNVIGS